MTEFEIRQSSRTYLNFKNFDLFYSLKPNIKTINNTEINHLNGFTLFLTLPYLILTLGLLSNLIVCVKSLFIRSKPIYMLFIINMLIADSLVIALSFSNLIQIDQTRTILTHSTISCKLITYLIHVLTNASK